eukprot:6147623-Karenia_brevis.AAC.1
MEGCLQCLKKILGIQKLVENSLRKTPSSESVASPQDGWRPCLLFCEVCTVARCHRPSGHQEDVVGHMCAVCFNAIKSSATLQHRPPHVFVARGTA